MSADPIAVLLIVLGLGMALSSGACGCCCQEPPESEREPEEGHHTVYQAIPTLEAAATV